MRIILTLIIAIATLSCANNKARDAYILSNMNKSFKVYIRDNDLRKNYITELKLVKALEYKILEPEEKQDSTEIYEAKIWMRGTTEWMNSARIYNLNDTVTCYFDKDMRMLRLINPSQK